MIHSKAPRFAILLLFTPLLYGCGEPAIKPELTVLGIGGVKADVLASEAVLRIKVLNPHPEAMRLDGMTVRLAVAGESFAKGAGALEDEIPAFGSVEVLVPVTISSFSLVRSIRSSAKSREMQHTLNAQVTYQLQGDRQTASIRESGTLAFE